MSAASHDAIAGSPARPLEPGEHEDIERDATEFTEDLGEEDTSELEAAQRAPRPAAADAAAEAEEGAAVGHAAASGDLLRDRYLLESQLGSGGTGTVYSAVDLRQDDGDRSRRRVAIKLLRPELSGRSHSVARLHREFRQTQAVAHPNVVRFFDLDCDRGRWFIVMELLSGETLATALRRRAAPGLALEEALPIARSIAGALAHAHATGITHGDVKPGNIVLAASGPRLLDFGVAPDPTGDPAAEDAEAAVRPAATRDYASPEVLSGEAPEPRDDVYSLACVVCKMLTGANPAARAEGANGRSAARHLDLPADLTPQCRAVLHAALSPSRAARPVMAEMIEALNLTAADSIAGDPVPAGRRSYLAIASAAAAALALAVGILIGRSDSPPEARAVAQPAAEAAALLPPPPAPAPATALAQPAGPEPAAAGEEATLPPVAPAPDAGPGFVYFDTPSMTVSHRAVVAAIPLRHLSRTQSSARVGWRAIDGSARAGRDFGGAASGVESFVEGNSLRMLYVPILQGAGSAADRTFWIELTEVSGGATLGPTPRIEIVITGGA